MPSLGILTVMHGSFECAGTVVLQSACDVGA